MRTEITADRVITKTQETVERCLQALPVLDRNGNETGQWTFDSAGAMRGLKLLGDHVGAWENRALDRFGDTHNHLHLESLTLDEVRRLAQLPEPEAD